MKQIVFVVVLSYKGLYCNHWIIRKVGQLCRWTQPRFWVNHIKFVCYLCSYGFLLLFLHLTIYSYIFLDLSIPNNWYQSEVLLLQNDRTFKFEWEQWRIPNSRLKKSMDIIFSYGKCRWKIIYIKRIHGSHQKEKKRTRKLSKIKIERSWIGRQ